MSSAQREQSKSSSPGVQRPATRRAKGPSNYTGKLTWVNKDASNLAQNSKDEVREVHAHIQGQFVPWVRRQRKETVRSNLASRNRQDSESAASSVGYQTASASASPESYTSEGNLSHASTAPTEYSDVPRTDRFATGLQSQSIGRRSSEASSTSSLTFPDDLDPVSANDKHQSDHTGDARYAVAPTSIVGNGNYDPFNASTIYIDATRHDLLLLWGERVMNAIWPSLRTRQSKEAAKRAWAEDCREGVFDEVYLHGLLASAFIVKARLLQFKDESSATRLRLESYAHQAKCLKHIRQILSETETGRRIVLAIWAAASVSLVDGDVQTSRVHLANLKFIVDQMGGLRELPMLLRHKILIWDVVVSGFLIQRPVFPVSDWRSPRLKNLLTPIVNADVMQQVKTRVSIQKYMPIHSTFTERLRKHLIDHREALAVKNYADSLLTDTETAVVLDSWLYLRQRHLEASNLVLFDEIMKESNGADATTTAELLLEGCFCLAMTYLHRFIARHTLESAGCTPFFILRNYIEAFLKVAPAPIPSSTRTALLWMYFVGACGENELNITLPADKAQTWFTTELLATAQDIELATFSNLRDVFRKFLYDADTLDDFLMCLLLKQDDYKEKLMLLSEQPTNDSSTAVIKAQSTASNSNVLDPLIPTSNLGPIFRWTENLTLVCTAPKS